MMGFIILKLISEQFMMTIVSTHNFLGRCTYFFTLDLRLTALLINQIFTFKKYLLG